jgi:hypothetical protein
MTVLRFLAGLFLIAALIALVDDATQPLTGAGPFSPTSLGRLWAETAPRSLAAARNAMSHGFGTLVWNAVIARLLQVPTFILLGVVGVLLGYLGRRRSRIEIFTN